MADSDASDDDITFLDGLTVDETTYAGLVEVLERDADPRASMVAARLLAATGRGDALDWIDAIVGEDAPPDVEVAHLEREIENLGSWLQTEFASLDPDAAEGVVSAWLMLPTERLPDGRDRAAELRLQHRLREALERFPDGGPKRRMLAALAAAE